MGQGVISSGAPRVTDRMFLAAARALASAAGSRDDAGAPLLPPLDRIVDVSRQVAVAVAAEAGAEGLVPPRAAGEWERLVNARWWEPRYPRLRRRGPAA
jgi:malate dehydrogenase (oxaloacetate-decarboxylating)